MSRKSVILFVLVAAIPLAAFVWFGWTIASTEEDRVARRYERVLEQRLLDVNRSIDGYFQDVEAELLDLSEQFFRTEDERRRLARTHPLVQLAVVMDKEGNLLLPDLDATLAADDIELLREISPLLSDRDLVRPSVGGSEHERANQSATEPSSRVIKRPQVQTQGAWMSWYWRRGVNLIFRRQLSNQTVAAIVLSRSRWQADLIARLPTAVADSYSRRDDGGRWRIVLTDGSDSPFYQWGEGQVRQNETSLVDISVGEPLTSWRLKYYADEKPVGALGGFRSLALLAGLLATTCGLVAVLTVFYREYARELQEAERRVDFVNQVSHELKTPLTNIRMYADLLEMDLEHLPDHQAEPCRRRLQTIVSESQRLSRLIANVLTFARAERHHITIRLAPHRIDDVVTSVIDRFRPALTEDGIEISTRLNAKNLVQLDADVLEQILGNLISNVERYAASGKRLGIVTEQRGDQSVIDVLDSGPGIPADASGKIFQPFYRLSDRIQDATGTGIGLSISRYLARLHGGDVTLQPASSGATFRISLRTLVLPVEHLHDE